MIFLMISLITAVVAYHFTLIVTAYKAAHSKTFDGFVQSMIDMVRIITIIVVGAYVLLGSSASLFTFFALTVVATLIRVEYKETYDIIQKEINRT